MNCNHVKQVIDVTSVNGGALPSEAKQHIESCEICRHALETSHFLENSLRGLELEETPHGMDARIAARITAIAADRDNSKKRWHRAANLMPWLAAVFGVFGFLAFALFGTAEKTVRGASTTPEGFSQSSLILGDIWQHILAPQALLSGLSADFMVLGLFALCSIAAMGQVVRR